MQLLHRLGSCCLEMEMGLLVLHAVVADGIVCIGIGMQPLLHTRCLKIRTWLLGPQVMGYMEAGGQLPACLCFWCWGPRAVGRVPPAWAQGRGWSNGDGLVVVQGCVLPPSQPHLYL